MQLTVPEVHMLPAKRVAFVEYTKGWGSLHNDFWVILNDDFCDNVIYEIAFLENDNAKPC